MQWAQIHMLHGWWMLGPLALLLWGGMRRHQRLLAHFVDPKLVTMLAPHFSRTRLWIKGGLCLAVVFWSVIALSRPQWGYEWQEVKREGLDILVAIDVSKSMLTQDVKPNRLERTKLAVRELVDKLKGDRIGLIAFAGDAFLTCPLTVDYNGFILSLNDLSPDSIPRGGTNIYKAIEAALEGYENTPSQYKAIILVTDGDNLEADPLVMARKAKADDIKIYTVGIGTAEGELIQIVDEAGHRQYLKDGQGRVVKSRLNEPLLQELALMTGGIYVKSAGAQFGLDLIYEQELSRLEKREVESKMERQYYERFQWPLSLALILLLVETCLNTRKFK